MSFLAPSHQFDSHPWPLRQWHYLTIILLTILFYFPLVLPDMGLPAGGDFFAFHTPYRIYTSQKLHDEIFPLYAHEIFAGYPIFQDPQFALLYPVNLIFGVVVTDAGSQTALDAYMLINLVILSLSAVFFIRSFGVGRFAAVVAGSVACFNAFMVLHITFVNMIQVLSMSLYAGGYFARYSRGGSADIRMVLAAGIALAFGNLAGHPQTTMYAHYALAAGAAVLALRHWQQSGRVVAGIRMIAMFGLAFALGLLLAAVQLIPTAELISISTRASVGREAVLWSALDSSQFPMLYLPGFYVRIPWALDWPPYKLSILPESPDAWFFWFDSNLFEGYIAMGLVVTVLGLLGWIYYWGSWPVHMLGVGCLFLLGCATGDDLPFYGWLYDYVPGFSLVRVSTRILLVFYPAWALLAGLGMQALLGEPARALRAGRGAVAIFGGLLVIWGAWIFYGHRGDWLDTWIRAFTGDKDSFLGEYILRQRAAEFFAALQKQLLIAVVILGVTVVLLAVSWRSARVRVGVLALLAAVELALYSFGWGTAIQYPGIQSVESAELQSVPPKTPGRVLNATAPNSALHMGHLLANGYSVTNDDWVTAFQPESMPPFRLGIQETLVDLWNVSDIVNKRVPRTAQIGDRVAAIDDWGWVEIGAPWVADSGETSVSTRALMPTELTVDLVTTQPVKNFHIIAFSGRAGGWGDGTEVGRVSALNASGDVLSSAPVVLGKHVSDARYPIEGSTDPVPAHSRARLSYFRVIPNHWSSDVNFFDARLDLATSVPVAALKFEATGPYSTTLALNHAAAILEDDSLVVRDLFGAEGFREVESLTADYRVLHRDDPPGYARMVPAAAVGSYKQTGNIMWRMFSGELDARDTILIDKRKLNEEELRCVNAPHPPAFRGNAEIEWLSDRHGRVMTSANMHGWLFLSHAWDAGWRAEVDGEPVEIYRANGPFMAIPLSGGEHVIHIRYRPTGLVTGMLVSICTSLVVLVLWLRARRRQLPV